jgi:hypothetical protein
MRKTLKLVLPLLVATITLLMPPVTYACKTPVTHACKKPWKVGSGWFDMSIPDNSEIVWSVGNIMIVHYWGGGGYLHGTFEGEWIHDGMGEWDVVNLDTGIVKMIGVWDTPQGVKVDGVNGTIWAYYWGTANAFTGEFKGQWVITRGTGDLANLRGYGTMWANETGAYYTINYCFGPKKDA